MAAVESVDIRARVTGELLSQSFQPSTEVDAGDLLFVIEPAPYEAEVAAAEAVLEQANAALRLAEIEKQRIDEAFEKKAATEQERLRSAATVEQRNAEVAAAQAQLDEATIRLGYTQVRTPIAGRVDRNLVDVGNLVSAADATHLTTVTQLDPIHAYFDVSERIVLEYLERGKTGRVDGETEAPVLEVARASDPPGTYPFTGRVDYVAPRVNNETGTIRVRGLFSNEADLLFPGLFVRVRAPYETLEDAVVVPQEAIGTDLSGPFVMTVDEQGHAQRIGVELGEPNDDGTMTVRQGLTGDERVVVQGIQKARPGQPVTIREPAIPDADSAPAVANPPEEASTPAAQGEG
jgi:RND family efflux transporter MFP subunit